jgi:hypothetical protein
LVVYTDHTGLAGLSSTGVLAVTPVIPGGVRLVVTRAMLACRQLNRVLLITQNDVKWKVEKCPALPPP